MEEVAILPAQIEDLPVLKRDIQPHNIPRFHEGFIERQQSDPSRFNWFIAWIDDSPVGHIGVHYDGPPEEAVKELLPTIATVEALGVHESHRRKGIATQLIQHIEDAARAKGLTQVGLAVGDTDNPYAKQLYEMLGYKDWGKGTFTASWDVEEDGMTRKEFEVCTYLVKDL